MKINKYFKILTAIFFGLFLAAILFPYLYKDKLLNILKNECNTNLNAVVDFEDADISIFKSFPDLNLKIKNISVSGKDSFELINLFSANAISIRLDLLSLIKNSNKGIRLKGLTFDKPSIQLITNKQGSSNYSNLLKETKNAQNNQPSNYFFHLNSIIISQGNILYNDSLANVFFNLNNLNHKSEGNYTNNQLNLIHQNTFDNINFRQGSIDYLKNVKGKWAGNLNLELDSNIYLLNNDLLALNDLKLKIQAFIRLAPDKINTDITFSTPSSELNQLISLIPSIYQSDIKKIKTEGIFSISGSIKGDYIENISYPLFNVKSNIANGKILFPSAPFPIDDINLDLGLESIDALYNHFRLFIPKYGFNIQGDGFGGKLEFDQFPNDYSVNGQTKGKIKLENLQRAWPSKLTEMKGNLDLDLNYRFTERAVAQKIYDQIKWSGNINSDELSVNYAPYPFLHVTGLRSKADPKLFSIQIGPSSFGRSDLKGNILISNPAALMTAHKQAADINIQSTSNLLDLSEIQSIQTCDTCSNGDEDAWLNKLNFKMNSQVEKLAYEDMNIQNINLVADYGHDSMSIKSFKSTIQGSTISGYGHLNNIYDWANAGKVLSGTLYLNSEYFNTDPWISDSTDASLVANHGVEKSIPERTDIIIYPSIKKIKYDKYVFNDFTAKINMVQQAVEIHESDATLYGGKVKLNGLYSEQNPDPLFNIKLDLSKLGFSDLFKSSDAFKKLVPLAEFLEGVFSTSIVLTGALDDQRMPIWSQLDAAGVVETFTGFLSKFKPLEKAAKELQIPALNLIKWEKSKNWFEISKGIVHIKPFNIQCQGIPITISGQHSIDQNLSYNILWHIPRAIFEKNKIGLEVNNQIEWLRSEVSKKGLVISKLDTIFVNMSLTGNIHDLKTDLRWVGDASGKGVDKQIKDEIKEIIANKTDTLKSQASKEIQEAKDSLISTAEEIIQEKKDELKAKGNELIDSAKIIAEEKAGKFLDSLTRAKTGKILDSTLLSKADTLLGQKAKQEIEKINEKLKDWNPFKKKPKPNN